MAFSVEQSGALSGWTLIRATWPGGATAGAAPGFAGCSAQATAAVTARLDTTAIKCFNITAISPIMKVCT
jgi:hypothetical protein